MPIFFQVPRSLTMVHTQQLPCIRYVNKMSFDIPRNKSSIQIHDPYMSSFRRKKIDMMVGKGRANHPIAFLCLASSTDRCQLVRQRNTLSIQSTRITAMAKPVQRPQRPHPSPKDVPMPIGIATT